LYLFCDRLPIKPRKQAEIFKLELFLCCSPGPFVHPFPGDPGDPVKGDAAISTLQFNCFAAGYGNSRF
jgi:hypothetical protein